MEESGAGVPVEGVVMRGIINVIIGLLLVVGGLSGKFVLLGTNSSVLLAVFGGAIAGLGVYRLIKDRGEGE
jgi:hypothetical protein